MAATLKSNQYLSLEEKNGTRLRKPWITDLLVFVIGLLSAIYVNVGGNLYLAEIVLLVLLPYLLYTRLKMLNFSQVRPIIILGLGWLLNQIITDIYRGTLFADVIKGWALIVVFLTNFISLYLLIFPSIRRIALALLGVSLGLILQGVLQPTDNMLLNKWKYGTGFAVILLVSIGIYFVSNKKNIRFLGWSFILILVALFSFYESSRALGGVALLSAIVTMFRFTLIGNGIARRISNPLNIALAVILLFFTAFGIIQIYGYAAEQGYLGDSAQAVYQSQSSGELGVLLGGRREWLPATRAIMDSPILGYGSYARSTDYGQYLFELANLGYKVNETQVSSYLAARDFIPTHSHFLQGWVWAGILGGLFWLYILSLVIRALIKTFRFPTGLFMATTSMGIYAIWNILFSPLSNSLRLTWAFILVTLLFALFYSPAMTGETGPLQH